MIKVKDVALACKSKNAGPFHITFDIMFGTEEVFDKVSKSRSITPELIASLYGVPAEDVVFTEYRPALAYKATIRRPTPSGAVGDTDIYGAQQHAPLLDIMLDI